MKFIITENKRDMLAIKWLNDNFSDLVPYTSDKISNRIFFIKDNRNTIINYELTTKTASINYNDLWKYFEIFMGFTDKEIQNIIQKWIEKVYNIHPEKVISGKFGYKLPY
jgi:hypothetical protein